jgi:hypothetical protein
MDISDTDFCNVCWGMLFVLLCWVGVVFCFWWEKEKSLLLQKKKKNKKSEIPPEFIGPRKAE